LKEALKFIKEVKIEEFCARKILREEFSFWIIFKDGESYSWMDDFMKNTFGLSVNKSMHAFDTRGNTLPRTTFYAKEILQ